MPCPYGINIPSVFVHYNKMIREGNLPTNKQNPEYRKQRKAFLVGYDRSVPKLRQANHCIGCGECVPHCPQRIDIPKEMRRIDVMVENLKRDGKVADVEV
jgi:predicted aldo/keto reductase-like oxidoreductase